MQTMKIYFEFRQIYFGIHFTDCSGYLLALEICLTQIIVLKQQEVFKSLWARWLRLQLSHGTIFPCCCFLTSKKTKYSLKIIRL